MTRATTDDSAITSLGELMRLEKERLADEARGRLKEHQAKLHADELAAARLLQEDEARRLREAERDAERDRAAKVFAARLEAEKASTIERERVSAAEAAHEKSREKEREHELSVKRLELQAAAERSPIGTLVGYALALVVLLGSAGLHFGLVRPAAEAKLAEATSRAASEGIALGHAKDDLGAAKSRADGLGRELAESRSRVSALEAEVQALKQGKSKPGPAQALGGAPLRLPTKTAEPCLKGDPMCPTIETH